MITAAQLRAARALLGIGNVDSLMKLVAALGSAGIELIGEGAVSQSGGRGVRLKVGSAGKPAKPPAAEG
jgi:hypothetical protein